ncbi:MAG: hypothetical protein QM710_08520 [Flavobacterium sp.]
MKITDIKKIAQTYMSDGAVEELEIPFDLLGPHLIYYIDEHIPKTDDTRLRLGIKWEGDGKSHTIIEKDFNLVNSLVSYHQDCIIIEYPKEDFNSIHPFPDNIAVFSAEAQLLKTVEFPFMDYSCVYDKKYGKREFLAIEISQRKDNMEFEQGEEIRDGFLGLGRTKRYSGKMMNRKNTTIRFEKYTEEEALELDKMGIKIDFQKSIQATLSCIEWEEKKIFDPYKGTFSESYHYTLLEGYYGR